MDLRNIHADLRNIHMDLRDIPADLRDIHAHLRDIPRASGIFEEIKQSSLYFEGYT